MKIEVIEKLAEAYVTEVFDQAAAAFKESPTANNWGKLKRAMAVLQAWRQRLRPSNTESYEVWVKQLGQSGVEKWDAMIYARLAGADASLLDVEKA